MADRPLSGTQFPEALSSYLQGLQAETEQRWAESGGVAPGFAKDLGLAVTSIPTGLGALAEQLGTNPTSGGALSELNDQVWNAMSPAGKAMSLAGPEKLPGVAHYLAALPLAADVPELRQVGNTLWANLAERYKALPKPGGLISPKLSINPADISLGQVRQPGAPPLFTAQVPRNPVEQIIELLHQQPGLSVGTPALTIHPSGDIDVDELVNWVKTNTHRFQLADPLFKPEQIPQLEQFAQLPSQVLRAPASTLDEGWVLSDALGEGGTKRMGLVVPGNALGQTASDPFLPLLRPTIGIRSGMLTPSTLYTTLHEGMHAVHARWDPSFGDIFKMVGPVGMGAQREVMDELVKNMDLLHPPQGPVRSKWTSSAPELLAEGLSTMVAAPARAREMMPTFTKLVEDMSVHAFAKDHTGTPTRLPFKFVAPVVTFLLAQQALKAQGAGTPEPTE